MPPKCGMTGGGIENRGWNTGGANGSNSGGIRPSSFLMGSVIGLSPMTTISLLTIGSSNMGRGL